MKLKKSDIKYVELLSANHVHAGRAYVITNDGTEYTCVKMHDTEKDVLENIHMYSWDVI